MIRFFSPEELYGMPTEEAATFCNERINKLIKSSPFVYGYKEGTHITWGYLDKTITHCARLMFIEEIKKEPCKHEPILKQNEDGYNQRHICKHCGVELVTEWKEKGAK